MKYVVIALLNVKFGPILLPLKVDLFQIQEMLIVLNIDLLDFLLKHLLLIFLNHLSPLLLHLLELLVELLLSLGVCLYFLLDLGHLMLNRSKCPLYRLVLVLSEEELFAE